MKLIIKNLLLVVFFVSCTQSMMAQTFINKGRIEYEVKTNIQKGLSSSFWNNLIRDKIPEFRTSYWTLTFDNNKSIYEFEKWGEPKVPQYMQDNLDEKKYYYDFGNNSFQRKTLNFGTVFDVVGDSIPKLNWKLVNENREIAGFNCRKAYAVLFDSVYVFAFYTEEILLPGGPQSFTGLPGTILGITVPRLYTSLIATKVEVAGVDTKKIKTLKAKKTTTLPEMSSVFKERILKDWSSDDPEDKAYAERIYWQALL